MGLLEENHPDELIEMDFKLIIPKEAIQVRLMLEDRKHERFRENEKIHKWTNWHSFSKLVAKNR